MNLAGTYPTPNNYPAHTLDQTSLGSPRRRDVWNDLCFIDATTYAWQTFVPTSANLYGIGIALGRNNNLTSDPTGKTDGNVVIEIHTPNGSNNPGTLVGSPIIIPASSLPFASEFGTQVFSISGLTPGVPVGIEIKTSGMTQGCITTSYSRYANVYGSGVFKFSTNSGSTWTLFPDYALMFETYSAI
jgi:hypothetical protein